MSIYLNKDSKIIVQGMTGGMGSKHTTLMVQAGSNIVGGVNARKAGTSERFLLSALRRATVRASLLRDPINAPSTLQDKELCLRWRCLRKGLRVARSRFGKLRKPNLL